MKGCLCLHKSMSKIPDETNLGLKLILWILKSAALSDELK